MNANRLVSMLINILMRKGLQYFMRGQKNDPRMKDAAQRMKAARRLGRM